MKLFFYAILFIIIFINGCSLESRDLLEEKRSETATDGIIDKDNVQMNISIDSKKSENFSRDIKCRIEIIDDSGKKELVDSEMKEFLIIESENINRSLGYLEMAESFNFVFNKNYNQIGSPEHEVNISKKENIYYLTEKRDDKIIIKNGTFNQMTREFSASEDMKYYLDYFCYGNMTFNVDGIWKNDSLTGGCIETKRVGLSKSIICYDQYGMLYNKNVRPIGGHMYINLTRSKSYDSIEI